MADYTLSLDSVSCESVGIRLQGALDIAPAVPRLETVSVPGRNGDLHYYDGSYENRSAEVGAYVYAPEDVKTKFGKINEWLFGAFGYRRLETNDDSTHYMLARVANGATVEARINKIAPFRLEFDCKPQRFLRSGEQAFTVSTNGTYTNPTIFSARPLYKLTGTGNGSLTIGAYSADFMGIDGYLYYDAETENAYKGSTNQNAKVYAPSGLPFGGGDQIVNITGGITSVEILPRWWEL